MTNGLTILILPSITWPWCKSSEYKVEQFACKAEAIMRLSKMVYPYRSKTERASVSVDGLMACTSHASAKLLAWASEKALVCLNFFKHTFKFSATTCVLILGFCCKSILAIENLEVSLSNMYKPILESIKKLAGIGLVTIKFKITQINMGCLPKFPSFFKSATCFYRDLPLSFLLPPFSYFQTTFIFLLLYGCHNQILELHRLNPKITNQYAI